MTPVWLRKAFVFHGLFAEVYGAAINNSASNYPLVQLRSAESQQIRWLSPDPAKPFSDTTVTSQPVSDFPSGLALVTAFVDGIPSISKFTLISMPPPTPTPTPTSTPTSTPTATKPVPSNPICLPMVSGD